MSQLSPFEKWWQIIGKVPIHLERVTSSTDCDIQHPVGQNEKQGLCNCSIELCDQRVLMTKLCDKNSNGNSSGVTNCSNLHAY